MVRYQSLTRRSLASGSAISSLVDAVILFNCQRPTPVMAIDTSNTIVKTTAIFLPIFKFFINDICTAFGDEALMQDPKYAGWIAARQHKSTLFIICATLEWRKARIRFKIPDGKFVSYGRLKFNKYLHDH